MYVFVELGLGLGLEAISDYVLDLYKILSYKIIIEELLYEY